MDPNTAINPGTHMMVNNIDEQNMLLDYLKPEMRVLEFGLGYSTILIAQRVKKVISIEHDHECFKEFAGRMPANVQPVFILQNAEITEPGGDGTPEQFKDYVESPMMFATEEKFDVVFIDGRARVACAQAAAKSYLKEGGVIFIHDYGHPDPHYRRTEYEPVESFLKKEKQVFAMAMFTVKGSQREVVLTDQDPTGFGQSLKNILNDQITEMGGTPWPDSNELETEGQTSIDQVMQEQINELSKVEAPNEYGDDDFATPTIPGYESATDQPPFTGPQPAPGTPEYDAEDITKQRIIDEETGATLVHDKSTCWYSSGAPAEMNRFHDQHIKSHDITKHMEPFTRLLNCVVADSDHHLLDLGCGTAMLADWVPGFEYYGADLPHMVAGCALRNHPLHFYRGCDITEEDLTWIEQFDVIVMSGIIDVMEHPVAMLKKVLQHTKKYLLIHRQEITENGQTHVGQGPGYDGPAFHSTINRKEFTDLVEGLGFRIVSELACSFSNWEGGGSSFLLVKMK